MEQTQSQQMRQEMRQFLSMEQADLLEMPEADFQKMVADTERRPLFRRLFSRDRLIAYQRYPRTDITRSLYDVKEEIAPARATGSVEALLLNKDELLARVRTMGIERFRRCFLFPEAGMSAAEIAAECGLSLKDVDRVNELINDFAVMSEFAGHAPSPGEGIRYSVVASVETARDGFTLGFFSLTMARGRYSIAYDRFDEMRQAGAFSAADVKEARQLFKQLELINSRKDTLTRIIQHVVEKQRVYLESGDAMSLLPFSQKELARATGLTPSTVCRAIYARSLETPWHKEVPLKDFFPRPRKFRKELLRRLIALEEFKSDEAIKARLWTKYGVALSRRSVANMRKELKLPAPGRAKEKR